LQDGAEAHKTLSFFRSPHRRGIEKSFSVGAKLSAEMKGSFFDAGSVGGSMHSGSSDVASDSVTVHTKVGGGSQTDNSRISMSSAVSSSSHGSAHEEGNALGEVFMWGEGVGNGILGGGEHRIGIPGEVILDALLPKALESTLVLDVQNISCGGRHVAVVTKQGEVFSWGEESGGRLGHGVDCDVSQPQLVDALVATSIEFVSCGLYHSCAVTLSGDLYTWGDGTHNCGLLGHGNDISHWMPRRVNGPLEGIQVSYVACGHWHTALVTSAGQLFTFGDGTFGVLGHGDRKSVYAPREVEALKGLKTVQVACGVWHTAAVVEVMVGYSSASTCTSGKLFTWGDGDKGRLGHGDKELRLVPTCVAAVVDHNFRQVACGCSLTVALTTAGQVFTMGSTTYGQLGDPEADGKLPGLVERNLWEAYVEEIACGAHHVAILTHNTEVYTWGKGANGRLGHGDTGDRNIPTLVEALKDKQVKSIACGASFTAAICFHKWLSGTDQSVCSGCRQPFGFTRKRHKCYNCGVVFCHACSSRKAMKASLAPNLDKPYRVCDQCLIKLKMAAESGVTPLGTLSRRGAPSWRSSEVRESSVQAEHKVPRAQPPPPKRATIFEAVQHIDRIPVPKSLKKFESFSSRVAPAPYGFPYWGNVNVPTSFNSGYLATNSSTSKPSFASSNPLPSPRAISRAVSPLSRRSSPPRATTPTPTISGLTVTKAVVEDLKKINDNLSAENMSLRSQVLCKSYLLS
jgi:alpha-tubulin suppressor-like RCC1 family protein